MTQHSSDTAALAGAMADAVRDIVQAIDKTNQRVAAIEQLEMLDTIAIENPPHNALAKYKNGCWRYDRKTGWRCIADGLDEIEAIETDTGAKFIFTFSSGKRTEQNLTFSTH